MRYANIHTRFWIDPDISELGRDARELYLYLMSSPNSNMAGYYYLPMTYMLEHLEAKGYRYTIDTLSIPLSVLENEGKINYDSAAKVVLLRKSLSWNIPKNTKMVMGVLNAVKEVPQSRLLPEFVECAKQHASTYAEAWDRLLIGYRYPIDTLPFSGTGTGTVSGTGTGTLSTDSGDEKSPPTDKTPKQKSEPKPEPKFGDAARALATMMYDHLKADNALPAAKDFFIKQAVIGEQLLQKHSFDEWVQAFQWALTETFHRQKMTNLRYLGDVVWPQFAKRTSQSSASTSRGVSSLQEYMNDAQREEEGL